MKLVWSGLGFVVPILVGVALVVRLLLPSEYQADDTTFGLLALAVAALVLPLGLVRSRAGRDDHFMYLPLVAWGALLLVGGLIPIVYVHGSRFVSDRAEAAEAHARVEECGELADRMRTCASGGPPMAAMFQAMCEASDPQARTACVECVRAASDPCNPRGCESACRFGPPR